MWNHVLPESGYRKIGGILALGDIKTNMGNIPVEDYKDYTAFLLGYDSYEEMVKFESCIVEVPADAENE